MCEASKNDSGQQGGDRITQAGRAEYLSLPVAMEYSYRQPQQLLYPLSFAGSFVTDTRTMRRGFCAVAAHRHAAPTAGMAFGAVIKHQ